MKISTVKLSSDKGFVNGFSGRGNSSAHALVNEKGEFGFLSGENKPYMPVGGRKTLIEVYNMNCIEFRAYNYGENTTLSKPVTI